MWKCSKCNEESEDNFDVCWNCGTGKDGAEDPSFRRAEDDPGSDGAKPLALGEAIAVQPARQRKMRDRPSVLITTTPSVEGKRIKRYCGLVTGEAILGANVFKDFFASITDVVGGRAAGYEGELREARHIALEELEQAALDLGANAVVGVDLDYETIGAQGAMLMVSITGTAVVVE